MRAAAIDVGSNTIRMVIGECRDGRLMPQRYDREIVRLAGEFSPRSELADASISRALAALKSFHKTLINENISVLRVVGTAVLRRAANRQNFIARLHRETGLRLEVISGDEEARLTARGVLSVIEPAVDTAIIIDIGGGSTEFIGITAGEICFQTSYPLGVVRLCEEFSSVAARTDEICRIIDIFLGQLRQTGLDLHNCQLIGTAGTVTTLAALDLGLIKYDAVKINNHHLSNSCLLDINQQLKCLPLAEREQLAGMEKGRGDLILPGLEIILTLLKKHKFPHLIVADAGLLEGVFLGLCPVNSD